MRKVLLVEYSKSFIEDINTRLLLEERDDISITIIEDVNQVETYLTSSKFDVVVIYAAFCESRDWNLTVPVRSYARKISDAELSEKYKIKCYGIINRSVDLFDSIVEDSLSDIRPHSSFEDSERPTNVLTQADMPPQLRKSTWQDVDSVKTKKKEQKVSVPTYETASSQQATATQYANQALTGQTQQTVKATQTAPQQSQQQFVQQAQPIYQQQSAKQQTTQQNVQQTTQQQAVQRTAQQTAQQNVQQTQQTTQQATQQYQYPAVSQKRYSYYPSYQGQPYAYIEQKTGYAVYEVVQPPTVQKPKYSYYPSYQGQISKHVDASGRRLYEVVEAPKPDNVIDASDIIDVQPSTSAQNTANSSMSEVQQLQYKVTDRFKKDREQELLQAQELADAEFERDMGNVRKDAKCITVYSAKGGVGKTTICCELASFLALTKHNRGHYKVCIADFNIDFGDVMNTLDFNEHGATMITWANDIRMRIENGENPEDINYTEQEISVWLQKKEETGLYALLAPTSNVDSMNIDEKEMRVMVDNLIKNCGFDFVICDTGNNTRDSSFIALEKADKVLLVATQDINTAHCNMSFLKTAERVNFNMDKINLVINMVRPAKIVGFEASDLENIFRDGKTGKPYRFKTLSKIKHNNEVVLSGNNGVPLIYNTSHEFTHSIGEIARNITGEEQILAAPQKKENLFDRMFKKK